MGKIETPNKTSNQGRVLIVTDELKEIMPICDCLLSYRYYVSVYSSGKKALMTLREQDFDLLLADLKTCDMDGLEVLRSALNIKPTLFGIILIGQGFVQGVVEAMNAVAFDYILKPVNLGELMLTISRAMEIKSSVRHSTLRG
jgi:two-component system response regulator AtoC